MDFFEAVEARRSVRVYTDEVVPDSVMLKAFEAAIKAPNSSNTQTWNFYWVHSEENKKKCVEYCLNQSAARSAQEMVVIVADPKLWKRSQAPNIEYLKSIKAPKSSFVYYEKLIPFMYSWGFFNILAPFKWLTFNIGGLFRPLVRGPISKHGIQTVSVKSAALAAENFVLAIAAQGYATCMMEGFDESRMKRLLKLKSSAQVVMVLSVGKQGVKGTWGPQFRLPLSEVLTKI
jgi:nitroreductase